MSGKARSVSVAAPASVLAGLMLVGAAGAGAAHHRQGGVARFASSAGACLVAGHGGLPAGAVTLPDGSKGVLNGPAGFEPGVAPSAGTVTAADGVLTSGSWPSGTKTVTLPDGSQGVLNAPADFKAAARPSC